MAITRAPSSGTWRTSTGRLVLTTWKHLPVLFQSPGGRFLQSNRTWSPSAFHNGMIATHRSLDTPANTFGPERNHPPSWEGPGTHLSLDVARSPRLGLHLSPRLMSILNTLSHLEEPRAGMCRSIWSVRPHTRFGVVAYPRGYSFLR